MVKIQDYKKVVGDTLIFNIDVSSSAGVLDITGSTNLMTLKDSFSDSDGEAFIQVTGVITSAVNGQVTFTIPKETTALALPDTYYYYDIQITTSVGSRYTLAKGTITFMSQVTQS